MEFWAAEVKSGESLKVPTGEGLVLHLSQANLGEIKKDKSNESICLFVKVDGKKLVLGTLSSNQLPQQQFDLVFDRDFELSHNWKNGSVYFFGYKAANHIEDEDEGADFDSDSEEDIIPLAVENNVKPDVKVKEVKSSDAKKPDHEKDSAAKKGNAEKGSGSIKTEDDDDSDDSMSDDEDTDDEDEDESDSEGEDDSEEETPVKVESGKKKRSSDVEPVTPAANKKVKVTTPQKTDGKKGGGGTAHVSTPHPSKQAGKTPANQNQKTTKSGGSHVCKSCSRTFSSEGGLDSHTKAKHSAGK